MGMDYLPVYEGEESPSDDSVVKISTEKIQKLGVRTEVVTLRELTRTVRAVATVQADERRLYTVAPKFEGWIQRLYVNTTGQAVKKGDALMDVYSPELITAQHEYLIARKGMQSVEGSGPEVRAGMQRLAESALQRLRNWDISDTDLQLCSKKARLKRYVTLRSPANGVVLEKPAIQGKRFMPGEDAVPDRGSVQSVDAGGRVRTGSGHRAAGPERHHQDGCLSGEGVQWRGDVHLSHGDARNPYRQSAHRTAQQAGIAQDRHVRQSGVRLDSQLKTRCSPCPIRRCSIPAYGVWCWLIWAGAGSSRAR